MNQCQLRTSLLAVRCQSFEHMRAILTDMLLLVNRNRRRMQNMILAVGPGTPASCVLTSIPVSSDSGGLNASESDDENDIYNVDTDDDEIEMLESDEEDELEAGEEDGVADEEHEMESEGSSELEVVAKETIVSRNIDATDSDEDRLEAETEIARHLSARPIGEENSDAQESTQDKRSAWTLNQTNIRYALTGQTSDAEDSNSASNQYDSNNDESSDDSGVAYHGDRQANQVLEFIEQQIMRQHRRRRRQSQPTSLNPAHDNSQSSNLYEREVARSMKHGGCINTASWLDCGWRISTVSHEDSHMYSRFYHDNLFTSFSHSSNDGYSTPARSNAACNNALSEFTCPSEYPTQLITSGDDHVVKFWDVSQSMGSISPLPGGSATITPFSSPTVPLKPTSELISKWKNHVQCTNCDEDCEDLKHRRYLPGIVHPLLTLSTGE